MKKSVKILSILLIVAMLMITFSTMVSAKPDIGGVIGGMDGATAPDSTGLEAVGGQIISIITTAGIIIAVLVLVILGIKYMIGSASEKAEYKKTMIPYLVGAVLLLGASAIAGTILTMAGGITTNLK